MKIYLANPVPTTNEVSKAEVLEAKLSDEFLGQLDVVNPFDITPNMEGADPAQRGGLAKLILEANKRVIHNCDLMIAVIDDRDIGVIWEMGYAHAIGVDIISVSTQGYGNNIMIEQSVIRHIPNVMETEGFTYLCNTIQTLVLIDDYN